MMDRQEILVFAIKSKLIPSFLRFACSGLALLSWTFRPALAQNQTTHTAADFEAARTTAETALATARKALRLNAALRATAEDASTRLTALAHTRDTSPGALRNLSDISAILQTLVPPTSATAI